MTPDKRFITLVTIFGLQLFFLILVFLTLVILTASVRNLGKVTAVADNVIVEQNPKADIQPIQEEFSEIDNEITSDETDAAEEPVKPKEESSEKTEKSKKSVSPPSTVTPQETHKAGERKVLIFKGAEFAFRWCPPGKFMIGDQHHEVTLTRGFWIMETEVTQKQWKAVMVNNPSNFKGDELPVENVSWFDSQDFCKKCTWLGFHLKLPTEAQWEYACRAGTTTTYSGNIDDMAWHQWNSNGKVHPVGTKTPNAWGLYDMHGNVCEWCADWYGNFPRSSVIDPLGPSTGSERVVRRGSFLWRPEDCTSSSRRNVDPYQRKSDGSAIDIGFRCVIVP